MNDFLGSVAAAILLVACGIAAVSLVLIVLVPLYKALKESFSKQ